MLALAPANGRVPTNVLATPVVQPAGLLAELSLPLFESERVKSWSYRARLVGLCVAVRPTWRCRTNLRGGGRFKMRIDGQSLLWATMIRATVKSSLL